VAWSTSWPEWKLELPHEHDSLRLYVLGPCSDMRMAIGSRGSLLGPVSSTCLSVPSLFGRLSLFGRIPGVGDEPVDHGAQ
jgi:hypothetical protein